MNSFVRSGSPLFTMAATAMSCSLLFAGATRSGYAGDTIAQIASIPALLAGLLLTWRERQQTGWLLGWAAAALFVILLQLVPLPAAVWANLPLGSAIQAVHKDIGMTDGWRPLSVSPHDTWLSLLAFLPPAALFFSALHLSDREKTQLLQLLLVLALFSCLLGLWQVAAVAGYTAPAERPKSIDPTGIFLNRNHFSAFLYVSLVIAAAFMIDGWRDALSKPRVLGSATQFAPPALALLIIIVALALLLLARSRAGMIIAIAALIGAALLARLPDPRRLRQGALRWIILAGVAAFILMSQYAFSRILARFAEDPLQDGRTTIVDTAWSVGWSLMPYGTGLGTFVPVYKAFEQPSAALMGVYVNHAHNDLIEVWMETGIPGLVLLAFALAWIGRQLSVILFFGRQTWQPRGHLLSAAAGIAVVLLLAHSLVDYPLRTGALASVFALGCGILARPIGLGAAAEQQSDTKLEEPATVPEPASPASIEFRKFEMAAARVPEKWSANPDTEAGSKATENASGRTLVHVDKAVWGNGGEAPEHERPVLADDERWPEVWRKRTTKAPQ